MPPILEVSFPLYHCLMQADPYTADERLAVLLAANPQDELRRAQLKREMETISKAQEHLEGLSGDE